MRLIDSEPLEIKLRKLQYNIDTGKKKTTVAELMIEIMIMVGSAPTALSPWVSIDEWLPPVNEDVIIYGHHPKFPKRQIYALTCRHDESQKSLDTLNYHVTHWMKIPGPPDEGDTDAD